MPTEYVTCPHCGHRFAPKPLSPLASRILTHQGDTANRWRRGLAVGLRDWGIQVNADPMTVRAAMLELVAAGYAATIPYGKRGRVRYVGVPSMAIRAAQRVA